VGPPVVATFVTSDLLLEPLELSGEIELSLRSAEVDALDYAACGGPVATGKRRALVADVRLPAPSGGQGAYRSVLYFSDDTPVRISATSPSADELGSRAAHEIHLSEYMVIEAGEALTVTQEIFPEDFDYAGCFTLSVWDPAGHSVQTSACLPTLSAEQIQVLTGSDESVALASDPAIASAQVEEAVASARADRDLGCALGASGPSRARTTPAWLALLLAAGLVRRVRRRIAGGLVAGLGLACGSRADDVPEVPVCDGSEALTLRVFYTVGGQELGARVRTENGYMSFAVDGQCQYFISGGWSGEPLARDEGWRHGSLDPDLRRSLEQQTDPVALGNECEPGSIPDASALVVASPLASSSCVGQGPRATALLATFREWKARLWRDAVPMDQDLHLVAWEEAPREEIQPYAWPSPLPLRDYIDLDRTWAAGRSKRISAADAAPLRALRERYLSDVRATRLPGDGSGIPVIDGDLSARLFMRDALPYEDDRGLWPLSGE
jgi:hypothetical protein